MQVQIPEKPLIILDKITAILRGRHILANTTLTIYRNQNWAIIGPNGSGKSSLSRVLLGTLPVCQGTMIRDQELFPQNRISYVSFGIQQQLILREDREDEARSYKGEVDEVTTVREILLSVLADELGQEGFDRIVAQLHIAPFLDRGIRSLSNGETRKIMIARGLMKAPHFLILDEPFDGLDVPSRDELSKTIDDLMAHDLHILLITHRLEEISSNITHILCLKNCEVFAQGRKEEILASEQIKRLYEHKNLNGITLPSIQASQKMLDRITSDTMVVMRNVTVKYGETTILDHLNWTMKTGEHWAIVGPNGAGKSTLLSLISADNFQAYSNEIYLFGKRRGSGESIWDIKQKIGIVSAEFQIKYHSHISAFHVILSGFFDSIGLYQRSTPAQREIAKQWIQILGIEDKSESHFDQLSQGQQRMVLLARAMVKSPLLLILDEPCQGLDYANRKMVLDLVDTIGSSMQSHILYVTHHLDDHLSCINHVLQFEPNSDGTYSTICNAA
ncbi:MAG: molybdate ABC transporter ATP-binding protein ModF [SAR324 cluster bacterium]|nr:molybdate ABC transporter ATP-binding protein ModF [SAR324 cluster bacterium]